MARGIFPSPHPILKRRLAAGLSIRRLGLEARIDFRKVALLERGFSASELKRLARALDCALVDLQPSAEARDVA